MRTVDLPTPHSFIDALKALKAGQCLGIRPNKSQDYFVKGTPSWSTSQSHSFVLTRQGQSKPAEITADQYVCTWTLVVVDHNSLNQQN